MSLLTFALLIFLLPAPRARAAENPPLSCPNDSTEPVSLAWLQALQQAAPPEELKWWPADDRQIASAFCHRRVPFSDQEIEQGLQTLIPRGDRRVSRKFFGIELENESETLAGLLEALLRYQGLFSGMIVNEQEARSNQKSFSSPCRTVRCVLEDPAIFGPKLGPRLLFMLGRYGFNGSHYSAPNSAPWKDDEIDEVLMSLSDFPPSLLPILPGRQLTHFSRGFMPGEYSNSKNVLANSFVYVLDTWNKETPESRQQVIFHELGHVIGSYYGLDESAEWLKFSDWSSRTTVSDGREINSAVPANRSSTISLYAQTNPKEDFAETVVAYRYNPALLMRRSPEKYQFLKESVFDGLEYTSEQACAPEKSFSGSLSTSITQRARSLTTDPLAMRSIASQALQHCGERIVQSFGENTTLGPADLVPARGCLEQALAIQLASDLPQAGEFKYQERTRVPALERLRSAGADPAITQAFLEAVVSETRDTLAEMMVDLIQKEKYNYLTQPRNKLPLPEFCANYSQYAYQDLPAIRGNYRGNAAGSLFAYRHREFLNRFANEVCLSLHRGKAVIVQPTETAIRSEVARRIHF